MIRMLIVGYVFAIRSDGHAPTDVESWGKLTFESDHPTGADQTGR